MPARSPSRSVRRSGLGWFRGAGVLSLALAGCAPGPPPSAPLVVIVVDTLRADAVLDPAGTIRTPALASLAEDGALFRRAFSHASLTRPSHAALFSSRLPSEAGVVGNDDEVSVNLPLVAAWLRDLGYRTAAATSMPTVCGSRPDAGLARGFELYLRPMVPLRWATRTAQDLTPVVSELDDQEPFFLFAHFADPHYPYRRHASDPARSVSIHFDEELVTRVDPQEPVFEAAEFSLPPGQHELRFVSEQSFQVLHLQLFLNGRRLPYRIVEGELRKMGGRLVARIVNRFEATGRVTMRYACYDEPDLAESRRRYAEEVDHVDAFVGRLLDALRARGLYEKALIVFTSDHGEALGEHGLLQHGHNLFDELIHVPLLIKPPAGREIELARLRERADTIVSHIDVVPTVLDLLQLPALPGQRGQSLLDVGRGLHMAEGRRPFADQDQLCLRDERYKLVYHTEEERFFLYDLEADPDERVDVFAQRVGERPDWPDLLREIARLGVPGSDGDAIDPELEEELRALGYLGGTEDG